MHGGGAAAAQRSALGLLLEGGTMQLVAGLLALACLLLDLGWAQPALPNKWDPPVAHAPLSLAVTGVASMYVFASVPATVVYWRFIEGGTLVRAVQLALGCVLLALTVFRDAAAHGLYAGAAWHGALWGNTLHILMASVLCAGLGYLNSFPNEERAALASLVQRLRRLFPARHQPADQQHDQAELDQPLLDQPLELEGGQVVDEHQQEQQQQEQQQQEQQQEEEEEEEEEEVALRREHSDRVLLALQRRHSEAQARRRDSGSGLSVLRAFCFAAHAPFVFGCSAYILALSVCGFSLVLSFYAFEPNTSCYAWLDQARGSELRVADFVGSTYAIGANLSLHVVASDAEVSLVVQDEHSAAALWSSVAGHAFLRAGGSAGRAWGPLSQDAWATDVQTVDAVRHHNTTGVVLEGKLIVEHDSHREVAYRATFRGLREGEFALDVDVGPVKSLNDHEATESLRDEARIYLVHRRDKGERLLGFGTQLSQAAFESECVPVIAREKGTGRGLQPFTFLLNRFNQGAGGSWQHSHTAVPFYVSTQGRSMRLSHAGLAVFDLTERGSVSVELSAASTSGIAASARFALASSPSDLLLDHAALPIRQPPAWLGDGMILDLGGGEQQVLATVAKLAASSSSPSPSPQQAPLPVAAVLLRDWAGTQHTLEGELPRWNWSPSPRLYPDWAGLLAKVRAMLPGVRVLVYLTPFVASEPLRGDAESDLAFREAATAGCLALGADGRPLRGESTGGTDAHGVLRLDSARCREWVAQRIAEVTAEVDGWIADHGEGLPLLPPTGAGKGGGSAAHNDYAGQWLEVNVNAANAANATTPQGEQAEGEGKLVLSRVATSSSASQVQVHMLGNQLSSWDAFDGLGSAVTGALSSGLSGLPATASFIGGVVNTHGAFGLLHYERSPELLARWAELASLQSVALISHRGQHLISSSESALPQAYDAASRASMRAAVALHRRLWPIKRAQLLAGRPIAQHMWLAFPQDPEALHRDRQFMLGPLVLACPVLAAAVDAVPCYLPRVEEGFWTHLWTGARMEAGVEVVCEAPLGRPCVFLRGNATLPAAPHAEE